MGALWRCVCLLALSLCPAHGFANSLKDPYICGVPSCTPSGKFQYLPGITYHFEYRAHVNTWFAGSGDNSSEMTVHSNVILRFTTPCEGVLQLDNVRLQDQDENYKQERQEHFVSQLTNHTLRFAFHDGVITELCTAAEEQVWALNFKRGVLSLYQNTMHRFDIDHRGIERDIHGICDTRYEVRGQENTSLIVMKLRDLTECTDRYKYMSILQTVRYKFQSKLQTWPVLKSESKCRILIDHRVYKSVLCKERHLFEPFSGKLSGATTSVEQQLTLLREANATVETMASEQGDTWNEITSRSSLLHQHDALVKQPIGELRSARDVLKLLCKIDESTREDGPQQISEELDSGSVVGVWGKLVTSCRALSRSALAQLLARAASICPRARKHLIDALPYVASTGSVELIKDMLLRSEVGSDTAHEWLMSMAMIPRPKKEMLSSMLELLRHSPTDKVVSFTASSMLHSYCRNSNKPLRECCEEEVNEEFVRIFQNNFVEISKKGFNKLKRVDREKITVSIKALGNIGGFSQEFADLLMATVDDATAPTDLRVTAVDAFRRTPCLETREYFLHVFREDYVDVEVRIASYLQVIRCPDLITVRKIFHALRHETVNQVATFVWSHLNNLAQSSLPSRVEIQGLLSGNQVPPLQDNPDFRKYSMNYEQGVFLDQFNAGGNYEANVIFTPTSYIPRSLSLNLTVDMFGESINLLEVRARIEGFESYFESIFGNEGPLSKRNINEKIRNIRVFRSASDAEEMQAKIDSLEHEPEALKHQYPMADVGVKVFGNEISYWTAEGNDEMFNALKKLNPLYQIRQILSGKELSYKKASLFLDTTYAIPTGSGLPMHMVLRGASYAELKLRGSMQPASNPSLYTLNTEGNIRASVALNVAATMGVMAGGHSSTGIRVNMRLYTASAVDASVRVNSTQSLHLNLSLPYAKQEIFGAKSELIILHGDTEVRQQGLNQRQIKQDTCSWSTVDKAIGIKICAAYHFPNMTNVKDAPYFLMSGPSQYLVSLEKVDPTAKNYSFKYDWTKRESANHITLSFDTPNSKSARAVNASISFQEDSGRADMLFNSNEHVLKAHAVYKNTPNNKLIESMLDIDGQKHFDGVLQLEKHPMKNGYVYVPKMYLIVNDEKITELLGSLRMVTKKKVSQCDVDVEFQTKRLASRLQGYVTWNGPSRGAKLRLDYQFLNEPKQSVKMEGVLSNRNMGQRYDLYSEMGLEFTSYPYFNFFSSLKYFSIQSHSETWFNVSRSREKRYSAPKLEVHCVHYERVNGLSLDTSVRLYTPQLFALLLQMRQAGDQYSGLAQLTYNPKARDVVVSVRVFLPSGRQFYADGGLNITLPSLHPFTLTAKVHENSINEFAINAACVWFNGVDFVLDSVYHDQSTTKMTWHRVKLYITSNQYRPIAANLLYTQDNNTTNIQAKGEYNNETYGTHLIYQVQSETGMMMYGELDMGEKRHSVSLKADLANNTNVNVDVHVDQVRDIHLTYQRSNTLELKRLKALLSWDDNRDPSQKLSLDLQLRNYSVWDYAAELAFYYPDRMINGRFEFLLRDWFIKWLVRLDWSSEDVVLWDVKMYSEVQQQTVYALLSKLDTPFLDWQDTSLNLMWRYHDNLQAINGSMAWQRDRLSFSLLGDYLFRTNEFYGELSAVVNSTIPSLPRAAAIASHRHVWKKSADTLLSFQHNDDNKLMVNSSWRLQRSEAGSNVTGQVVLNTPIQGYNAGLLRMKFLFGNKRDVNGVTYLDVDERKYKIAIDGHMRRLSNSMLVINVTSSVPQYSFVNARFGFVEADRHFVAMVTAPKGTTGFETLAKIHTSSDFHVYAHIALPIQFLNRALVLMKRGDKEVDFHLGWDKMDLGVTGIWHYENISNFQYMYKLFTPLEGFEENGCVLKNIYRDGLDSEFSVRLSKHKFGVAVLMRNSKKGIIEVIEAKLASKTANDFKFDDFETDTYITLDTLYYPTVTFQANVNKGNFEEYKQIFKLNSTLNLPGGQTVTLTDQFVFVGAMTMTNELYLITPFPLVKELKTLFSLDAIMGELTNITFQARLNNGTSWHETSVRVLYETSNYSGVAQYEGSLHVATPLSVLPSLEVWGQFVDEQVLQRINSSIRMPSFAISATGQIEIEQPFVVLSTTLNLTSPYLEDYFISMEHSRNMSQSEENFISGGVRVQQGNVDNFFFGRVNWDPTVVSRVRAKARAALAPVLPPSELIGHYTRTAGSSNLYLECHLGEEYGFYSLSGVYSKDTQLNLTLKSPVRGFRNVVVAAKMTSNHSLLGTVVTDNVEYSVDGKIKTRDPLDITFVLIPKGNGEKLTIRSKVEMSATKYSASASMIGRAQWALNSKLELDPKFTDLYFKLDSPQVKDKELSVKARMDRPESNRGTLSVQATTPWNNLRQLKADGDALLGANVGAIKCHYDMTDMSGDSDLDWRFDSLYHFYLKILGHQKIKEMLRSVDLKAWNEMKNVSNFTSGFWMDLDRVWQIGANYTYLAVNKVQTVLIVNAILPKPNVDVHTIQFRFGSPTHPLSSLLVQYNTDNTTLLAGLQGQWEKTNDRLAANASIRWGSLGTVKTIDNRYEYASDENSSLRIDYSLHTPFYPGETFSVNGSYDKDVTNHLAIINGEMRHATRSIGVVHLGYGDLRRSFGEFNITTPFSNLPWLKSIFNLSNSEVAYTNKIDLFWPNKTANLITHHYLRDVDNGLAQFGNISLALPLKTKRVVSTEYYFVQSERGSQGNATLDFDAVRFVKGTFDQILGRSARSFDLATTNIQVENEHTPLGIKYIHEMGQNGDVDVKDINVFNLRNGTSFNMSALLDVASRATGKSVKLTIVQAKRSFTLESEYDAREKQLVQGSKLTWGPDVWIHYNINFINTSSSDTESQKIIMDLLYPRRNFNLVADYSIEENLLDGAATLAWDLGRGNKSSTLRGRWENPPARDANLQLLHVSLHHPSFQRDVTFEGAYSSSAVIMSNISMDLRYSDYDNEHLKFKSVIKDNSNGPTRDYMFELTCTHPTSSIDVEMRTGLNIKDRWYSYGNYYRYKKNAFSEKLRVTDAVLDLDTNYVKLERANESDFYNMNGTWRAAYPLYRADALVNKTTGLDTAALLLSLHDKSVVAHYNSTDDISYHLVGKINDARSAELNSWRHYDDFTTVDVASYIRLNHSRLLVSSVRWRPQIFGEVRGQVVGVLRQVYVQINESLTVLKETPMESHYVLKTVWSDAKMRIRDFLDDLNDLHVIKDDLDEFHTFLNESYENNDFYVRNIVEFSYYVLDEMALKNEFESLPAMVNEMWGLMGETSTSIKKSLSWVVETIKASYTSFMASFNNILEADFMEQVSGVLENAILQYDNFIRDVNIKLISYWERTWTSALRSISASWKNLLKSMEPSFLKFVHYAERFVWTVGKEVMDFFYQRTHELTESPYFNYVSTLGQDLDHFIKDLTHNDAIHNIKKYGRKAYEAIYNRFLAELPFRKELEQVCGEILTELNQLRELTIVTFIKSKYVEAKGRLQWWYDYFHLGEAIRNVWEVIYAKLTEKAMTALNYEENHRTPKTNFIFDPIKGEIVLEQKLPMSWHAFNRTPDFSEIPEYKAVKDIVDNWIMTNRSIWSYYYDIKPYLDLNNVVPPFAAMAIMTGQGTIVTYDKQVFTISTPGTYLLCHDYKQGNLSILMSSNERGTYDLLVLTGNSLVRIDLYREHVSIGDATALTLPASVAQLTVERQKDSLSVMSGEAANIDCNLKLKTCKIQLNGWYYATVGGLLGTMTNEQYDDLQLPNGSYTADVAALGRGWCLVEGSKGAAVERDTTNETQCDNFFRNKVSPLHPCFHIIDAMPFYKECMAGVESCSLASSYLEMCSQEKVPINVPEQCVQCVSPQGEIIEEGSFFTLEYMPRSSDVVFLVEAQYCNKNLRKRKALDGLVDSLEKKLLQYGVKDNRYAVVGFGGSGLYREPKSLYVDNKVFVNSVDILAHFDNLYIEKRDLTKSNKTVGANTLSALSYASSLPFRPAVSKTYILLACSSCNMLTQVLDYSVVQQVLMDDDVTLHVILDEDLKLRDRRVARTLLGVDATRAYTMKDARKFAGDEELRKQVKLPKDKMELCIALALESNGTVMSGVGTRSARGASVWAERAAQSAVPDSPAPPRCECRDTGLYCNTRRFKSTRFTDMSLLWDDDVDDLIDNMMDINLPGFS